MKLVEQGRNEIKKFKERRIALLQEIEDELKKMESDWRAKINKDIRISIKYPIPKSGDQIQSRLKSVEIDNYKGENSSFSFQFPSINDEYGKVSIRAIKENLERFSERELKELLASFDLDEEREMTIEEIS